MSDPSEPVLHAQRFRRLDRSSFDVIVVGSGVGGLVAAAFLARHGRRTLVVDQHYVAGGNATVFRRPGYEFDVGVHYLGECGPDGMLSRILRGAGARMPEFLELDAALVPPPRRHHPRYHGVQAPASPLRPERFVRER